MKQILIRKERRRREGDGGEGKDGSGREGEREREEEINYYSSLYVNKVKTLWISDGSHFMHSVNSLVLAG